MTVPPWAWIAFTVIAALALTLRNLMQHELTARLGTIGATHVRFLFGLPFALLFLAIATLATRTLPPLPNAASLAWTAFAALTQIIGTALLLAALQQRSFVVTIAYSKSEPVLVALFGLMFLGEVLTGWVVVAILITTAGVFAMSWPKADAGRTMVGSSLALGVGAAAFFAVSATCFRGAILALGFPNFVVAASTILTLGLAMQTLILTLYLLARDRATLAAILSAWRPSMTAGFMGAFASQMWYLAFAIENIAKVRTLGLLEILFAHIITRRFLKQGLSAREKLGIGLLVGGVALLLSADQP